MPYKAFCATDKGLAREHNEDAFVFDAYAAQSGQFQKEFEQETFLAAVADGVGGNDAGEIASMLCAKALSDLTLPVSAEGLNDVVQSINREIIRLSEEKPAQKEMATTVAGIAASGGRLYVFNVGDSRVYRYRNGVLVQITTDDTLVQSLYDSGRIEKAEILLRRDRHVLTQSLGGHGPEFVPEVHIIELKSRFEADDVFLICSDGLSDMLKQDEIETALRQHADLRELSGALFNEVMSKGAEDNFTFILLKNLEITKDSQEES